MKLESTRELYPSEWIAFRATDELPDPEGQIIAHDWNGDAFRHRLIKYRQSDGRPPNYFVDDLYITFSGPVPVPKATGPDGETDLVELFVGRCLACRASAVPRVRHVGTGADWANFRVSWKCSCGAFAEIQVGYDWGEIVLFAWGRRGNPDNFGYER
jgi:hypothetical protein